MPEVNLLKSLPQVKRNIQSRNELRDQNVISVAKQYGREYFDGERKFGYGGYRYDGRWLPVAQDIIDFYNLKPGMRVLDIGCAKGFLVKDLIVKCPGLEVFGLDVSEYAIRNCEPEIIGRLHLGSAETLPFPDKSFDLVISLNTIHNFSRDNAIKVLKEITRISKKNAFVQVDSYFTNEQKNIFESWVLTAEFHDFPEGWKQVFAESDYQGDYFWTIIE
jgi:cyclopropane fatty-acyl-phospholipid synthase-like methyltransferase